MPLKKIEKLNKIRRSIAKKYHHKIDLKNKMPYDNNCSYHLYWIRVKNRKEFMKKMKSVLILMNYVYFVN